jgi:hypothetical protein
MMHVFYLGEGNVVKQVYRDSKGKWCEGDLDREKIVVAPYAMMCACFVEGSNRSMRVYVQMQDNNIQEFGFDGTPTLAFSLSLWGYSQGGVRFAPRMGQDGECLQCPSRHWVGLCGYAGWRYACQVIYSSSTYR